MAGECIYPESFLSKKTKEYFLACIKPLPLDAGTSECPCVGTHGLLNMDAVGLHIIDFLTAGDFHAALLSINHTIQLCSIAFEKHRPIVEASVIGWLCTSDRYIGLKNLACLGNTRDRLPISLQLVSMLEFSLSQQLGAVEDRGPNHFSDIIDDPRLAFLLDSPTRAVLKQLFGPTPSLNLQNLLWHGFISPTDCESIFPQSLMHFLFVLIECIGEQIAAKQSTPITSLSKLDECHEFISNKISPVERGVRIIQEPAGMHIPFLQMFTHLFMEHRFRDAISIGVLCLSTILRNELCRVLGWLEGITYTEDRRFLTLEAILDMDMDGVYLGSVTTAQWIQFSERVGPKSLFLLSLVFCAPQGPRLNKRLAHGELYQDGELGDQKWQSLCNCVNVCIVSVLDSLAAASSGQPGYFDPSVRYAYSDPFHIYAVSASALWAAWSTLYGDVIEIFNVSPPNRQKDKILRYWFPNIPPLTYDECRAVANAVG